MTRIQIREPILKRLSIQCDVIMWAAYRDQTDATDILISKGNENLEATNNDCFTALISAAQNGSANIVELLITQFNANVEATSCNCKTALMWAALNGHTSAVELLSTKLKPT